MDCWNLALQLVNFANSSPSLVTYLSKHCQIRKQSMICHSKETYAVFFVHFQCTIQTAAYSDFYNLLHYSFSYISILHYNGHILLNTSSYLLPYMPISSAKKQLPVLQPFSGTWMPTKDHYWAIWWLVHCHRWEDFYIWCHIERYGTSASHMPIPAGPNVTVHPSGASVLIVSMTLYGAITTSTALKESSAKYKHQYVYECLSVIDG